MQCQGSHSHSSCGVLGEISVGCSFCVMWKVYGLRKISLLEKTIDSTYTISHQNKNSSLFQGMFGETSFPSSKSGAFGSRFRMLGVRVEEVV
jgi:hypothetical protein